MIVVIPARRESILGVAGKMDSRLRGTDTQKLLCYGEKKLTREFFIT